MDIRNWGWRASSLADKSFRSKMVVKALPETLPDSQSTATILEIDARGSSTP